MGFANPADYDKMRVDDPLTLLEIATLAPGQPVMCRLIHADRSEETIELRHTFDSEQIEWHRAGSALNALVRRASKPDR